ncbi:hypothetical protein [Halalkalibacter alkaliphilus]|uniref:Uncharacterized protein n=1 Tax=Halalkalibacter alkaliphilus TaxID=2917993 RepID=A0A9X2I8U5_9BACI|nr:hypothetical protein [Halalkalibacter alkaliphilus]MCL7748375.1 hypothetical protein [Halalkalibacter alkaliphilus]
MINKKRNRLAFGLLFFIHSTLLLVTFIMKKDRKNLFIALLSNISFAYFFEYFVLNVFQAYKYKPKFLKNRNLDNIFGALLSQAIFIPFTSLYLTAFEVKWRTKLFVNLYFVSVEFLFLRMKIYKLNWWNPIFTGLAIPVHFYLSDIWYKHIKKGTPIVLSVSLFNMILVTSVNILFLLVVLRKLRFGIGKVYTWYEHFLIGPLYSIVYAIVATKTVKVGDWISKCKLLAFSISFHLILKRLQVLKSTKENHYLLMWTHLLMVLLSSFYKQLVNSQEVVREDEQFNN